jgi:hypothetical protein
MSASTRFGAQSADIHIGCASHGFERAVGVCRRCHKSHCADCLVFPFGIRKPGLCIHCALVASGIRRH